VVLEIGVKGEYGIERIDYKEIVLVSVLLWDKEIREGKNKEL